MKDWLCSQPGCGLWHSEHKKMKIDRFIGRYRFLSNFYIIPIQFEGDVYPSVEHAYQAAKTPNQFERDRILKLSTAGDAKRAGREITIRPDWETIKIPTMRGLVKQKFNYTDLATYLKETGDAELIEGNYWHDNFWGACSCLRCQGLTKYNKLGLILTEVRDEQNRNH